MFNQYTQKIQELLSSAKHITVVVGQNPDLDMMAAGLSLYLSLSQQGKQVSVVCPTSPTVALGNLVGIDKVKARASGLGGANGLVISLPYQQGAIEKISYDIIGDRINLTVVPGPDGLNFTTDDIRFQQPSQASDLLIALGVLSEDHLDSIMPESTQVPVINIDYTLDNTGYGTVPLVDPAYSSVSEIIGKLITSLNLPLDADIAQNLLSGIVDKTANFQDKSTSAYAFELSGQLIKKGAMRTIGPAGDVKDRRNMFGFDNEQQQSMSAMPKMQQPVDMGARQVRAPVTPGQQVPILGNEDGPIIAKNQQGQAKQVVKTPKDWLEPKIYRGSTPVS